MVLTMKLTSFAYNLYDGTYDHKRVFGNYNSDKDQKKAKIYAERKKFAIEGIPNMLEFFGYIYCFTCILAGPAFEYTDYLRSINGSIFRLNAPGDTRKQGDKENAENISKPPSSIIPGLLLLLQAVVFLVGNMKLFEIVKFENIFNPDWIAQNSWTYRFPYSLLWLFAKRLQFYFVWKIAEGASVMGGFGFQGYRKQISSVSADKEVDRDDENKWEVIGWKNVENIDVLGFELATG